MDYCNGKAQVIVINDNYKLAPWADILYACDPAWWKWHEDLEFSGRKITQDKAASEKHGVEYIESRPESGLSADTSYINQGSNSGYQAINLAYNLGAKRIILLGYDMQFTNGKSHHFGDHPNGVRSDYTSFISAFKKLSPPKDLEIINCTRQTALKCFPLQDLKDTI